MNVIFSLLQSIFRRPFGAHSSEDGGDWNGADRNRSLMMGMPAIVFGLTGISLLTATQFVSPGTLESKYQLRLSASKERAKDLGAELEREIKMQLSSGEAVSKEKIDSIVPPDDPRRLELERRKKEQRIFLRKLSTINPDNDEYMFELAQLTISERGPEQVASGLAMIRKISPLLEPGYVPGHLFLARREIAMAAADAPANRARHLSAALRHLDNTLLREPNNDIANKMLGSIYYQQGRFEKAYPFVETLFKSDPVQYRTLIEINNRLDRPENNVAILDDALSYMKSRFNSVSKDDREARSDLIKEMTQCYLLQKDFPGAKSFLEEELAVAIEESMAADRVKFLKNLLCLVHLEWVTLFPGRDKATQTERLQKLTEAFKYSQKHPDVKRLLTRIAGGEFADLAAQARAIYDASQDPDAPSQVINELGIEALSRSEYQAALELFTKAKNKMPRNPEILNNLAYTHLKSENPNPKLALALVNDAIRFTPNRASMKKFKTNFLDTRARAYMQLGQYSLAIADLTRAWQDREDNLEIMQAIIDCYRADNMESDAAIWEAKLDEAIKKQKSEVETESGGFAVPKLELQGN